MFVCVCVYVCICVCVCLFPVGAGDPDVVVGLPLLTGTITTPATMFELIFVICYLPCTSSEYMQHPVMHNA